MRAVTDDRRNGTMPPGDTTELEESLIGVLLVQPELLQKVEFLSLGDFKSSRYGLMFDTITNMDRDGKPISAVTVADEMGRFGHSDDIPNGKQLLDLIERCSDAAPHIEYIAQKVAEESKRRKAKYHYLEQAKRCDDPLEDVDELLAKSEDYLNSLETGVDGYEFITSEELLNCDEEIEYLIEGVMVARQPCVFSGPKKCLKTNTMIDMCLSLSSGSRFLGEWRVPRAVNVGIMSGESGKAVIKETAKRIADSKCMGLEQFTSLYWSFQLPKFGDAAKERQLERFIREKQLEVLMIDPAYLCIPLGDEAGNMFASGPMLRRIGEIGERADCAIVLAHHMTKKGSAATYKMPGLEDIAWSGFQEYARQWLLVNRRKAYSGDKGGSHALWFHAGGSAGHSQSCGLNIEEGTRDDEGGRRWEVEILSVSEADELDADEKESINEDRHERQKEKKLEQKKQKVIGVMLDYPNGTTISNIKTNIKTSPKLGYDTIREVIRIMVEREEVEELEIRAGKNNRPCTGYRLLNPIGLNSPTNPETNRTIDSSLVPPSPPKGGGTNGLINQTDQSVSEWEDFIHG